ncbi:uncharacterized protein LOC128892423 [Hylaeus anthracinus]|uniref:uncharacterized protein LOC128892423 n=1 Tax=Hylaeus anthracinus TaxID=313031 RepID=UPI0023B99E9D|nr:uncharacterized protein LOC128892423 [Hylaeus anthracinus]XP_054008818.1 uncharacterized protein LOC128892423 [Hylaeus anthracinus]
MSSLSRISLDSRDSHDGKNVTGYCDYIVITWFLFTPLCSSNVCSINVDSDMNGQIKFLVDKMTVPQTHQIELITLAELAGISAIPGVYRIILELLELQISPEGIYIILKQIYPQSSDKQQGINNVEEAPDELTTH